MDLIVRTRFPRAHQGLESSASSRSRICLAQVAPPHAEQLADLETTTLIRRSSHVLDSPRRR